MGGRSAARAIQQRRQAAGRFQIWPVNVKAPSKQDYKNLARQTFSRAPVRIGTTTGGMSSATQKPEAGQIQLTPVASNATPLVDFVQSEIVNPAEAGIFTRLASVANAYQKFRCVQLQFAYVPSCGSQTNGSLAIAFLPDLDATVPTTYEEILAVGGNWTTPIWVNKALNLEKTAMGKAFSENYVKIPVNVTEQNQINVVGRLVWCVRQLPTANYTYGDIKLNYAFMFSDPKTPELPPSLSGSYDLAALSHLTDWDLEAMADRLTAGYHMFAEATATAGVYRMRTHEQMLVMVKGHDTGGAANPDIQLFIGDTEAGIAELAPVFNYGSGHVRFSTWVIPKTSGRQYVKMNSDKTLSAGRLEIYQIGRGEHDITWE